MLQDAAVIRGFDRKLLMPHKDDNVPEKWTTVLLQAGHFLLKLSLRSLQLEVKGGCFMQWETQLFDTTVQPYVWRSMY